ncbi:MAG: cysteine hydrolase family protein [Candidatus Bathyarchaeota archaeon]
MGDVVFWDVDTQNDFIEPNGRLYVSGAEGLRNNLRHLTCLGAEKARLCGSVDAHRPDDPEFSDWPVHCVYGTRGQLKVTETLVDGTLFMPSIRLTDSQLSEAVAYFGRVIFEKQGTDVRGNPNVKPFMELVKPDLVVVYGVVSEICVNHAVDFLGRELGFRTVVVGDAIKELDKSKADICWAEWKRYGVEDVCAADVEALLVDL